ncbi:hypothetical protein BM1374165_00108 [Bartonella henselae]|uniref:Uncharacterized protein n=1 Tax=Bartonella henselae TaxID=38323 RepID=X5M2Z0_BARHN|nr:hypothetical protein BM1374165_00108 [Bartonella henselae]
MEIVFLPLQLYILPNEAVYPFERLPKTEICHTLNLT